MIVTFRAAARSRAATRSPRAISPGAAGATVKGLPWYLGLTPLAPVKQSWHLLSRYQPCSRTVNRARTLGSAALSCTRSRGSVPSCVVPVRRITRIR
jgi:hypothetical protein